ncbi:MAG: tetratricopeptide repeat protein, partial [Gemmataceae bacterium]|nr:tetratricopeptide repeat protein [Gemmataceae bacterium]
AWRLAEGLAHAHARGILHRDLKPANILLADDGEPLLLDFNLADGKGMAGKVESAYVGGTLPYMAPEQIRYYAGKGPQSDARADVYAVGLILYELLTGRPTVTWPGGSVDAALAELSKARSHAPDSARRWNPDVSPALAAIVAKCLTPDPEQRYPSARELAEDLAAQRRHEPLRHQREPSWRERAGKWVRRHPSATSGATVATVSAVLLFAATLAGLRIHQDRQLLAQRDNYRVFEDDVRAAQIALAHPSPDPEQWKLGTAAARRAWERFPDASPELPEERGRLAYLLARSEWQAAGRTGDPAVRQQHLDAARHWNEHAGRLLNSGPLGAVVRDQSRWLADPKTLDEVALAAGTPDSADAFLSGQILLGRNRPREAAAALARATQSDPTSVLAWYTRGMAAQSAGRLDDALSSFSACIALSPKRSDVWRARGNVLHAMGRDDDALPDLDRAVALAPDVMAARLDRGLIKMAKGDLAGAEADITAAIEGGYPETRLHFLRARIRDNRGNKSGAAEDRATGFGSAPQTEADWQARALARLPGDPQAALKDLEQCLVEYPASRLAYENRAYIEDAILKRPAEALAALDEAVRVDPAAAITRATRGVLRARAKRFAEAREDAARAMELESRPSVIYAVAGIYALTAQDRPADRDRALFLLSQAVHLGYGLDLIDSDPELASLRALPEVRRLVAGAKQNSPRRQAGG